MTDDEIEIHLDGTDRTLGQCQHQEIAESVEGAGVPMPETDVAEKPAPTTTANTSIQLHPSPTKITLRSIPDKKVLNHLGLSRKAIKAAQIVRHSQLLSPADAIKLHPEVLYRDRFSQILQSIVCVQLSLAHLPVQVRDVVKVKEAVKEVLFELRKMSETLNSSVVYLRPGSLEENGPKPTTFLGHVLREDRTVLEKTIVSLFHLLVDLEDVLVIIRTTGDPSVCKHAMLLKPSGKKIMRELERLQESVRHLAMLKEDHLMSLLNLIHRTALSQGILAECDLSPPGMINSWRVRLLRTETLGLTDSDMHFAYLHSLVGRIERGDMTRDWSFDDCLASHLGYSGRW